MSIEIIHNVPAWHPALSEEGWLSVNDARPSRIVTEHVYPPVPFRDCDWSAVTVDYEPGHPIGRGPTEAAAIADLKGQLYVHV